MQRLFLDTSRTLFSIEPHERSQEWESDWAKLKMTLAYEEPDEKMECLLGIENVKDLHAYLTQYLISQGVEV
jgi:hypothetical protein